MIIPCYNCNKKFDVDASFIPKSGRLLKCNSCNHKWFFKQESINGTIESIKINKPSQEKDTVKINDPIDLENFEEKKDAVEAKSPQNLKLLDQEIKNDSIIKKVSIKEKTKKGISFNKKYNKLEAVLIKKNKSYIFMSSIIVFIISFIALIVVIDTLQKPISKIIPNIEFLLYNLYESINEISLFFKDLT